MKILLVSGQFRPLVGGVPSVYENLCRHLGDTVTVLTQPPADSAEARAWDARQPYTIRRIRRFVSRTGSSLPKPFSWVVRYVSNQLLTRARVKAEFSRVLDEVRPDVVCFGTLLTTWWLAPLVRSRRLPVVYYIHAEEVCGIRQSRMDGDRPKDALLRADALIAVSRFTRDVIRGLGGDLSRVHILSNGVDTGRFRPGLQDPGLMARYGLGGKRVLLTLARLDERKGQDRVIQALPAILRAFPDTVYVIAGAGAMQARLEALAGAVNVSGQVVFTGLLDDRVVADHYRLCDVFLMPNRTLPSGDTEGFGLVFLEAGACARPVIGGNAGGVPDAIDDGETGLLVDGNSVEQIARAAVTLLGDPGLCRRMGEAGLRKAVANDWRAKAAEFQDVLGRLVGAR